MLDCLSLWLQMSPVSGLRRGTIEIASSTLALYRDTLRHLVYIRRTG